MNRPVERMNRQLLEALAKPFNLRLMALVGLLVVLMQLDDATYGDAWWQPALFWGGRVLGLIACLSIARRLVPARWRSPDWLGEIVVTTIIATIPLAMIEMSLESLVPQPAAFDDSALRKFGLLSAVFEPIFIKGVAC